MYTGVHTCTRTWLHACAPAVRTCMHAYTAETTDATSAGTRPLAEVHKLRTTAAADIGPSAAESGMARTEVKRRRWLYKSCMISLAYGSKGYINTA